MPPQASISALSRRHDLLLEWMHRVGALDLLHRRSGRSCNVLLYHSVTPDGADGSLATNAFAAQMRELRSGFHVIGGVEYLWHLKHCKPFRDRTVLITFDDGLENNHSVVQPIMRELGLPWVLFTTTAGIVNSRSMLWLSCLRAVCRFAPAGALNICGREFVLPEGKSQRQRTYKKITLFLETEPSGPAMACVQTVIEQHWNSVPNWYVRNRCRLMTASQMTDLASSGLVEIGCHTERHPFLTQADDDELAREIHGARSTLHGVLGHPPRMFAYPSGNYGKREAERVARAGFECAFAVQSVAQRFEEYEIPRTGIYAASVAILRAKALGFSSVLQLFGVSTG